MKLNRPYIILIVSFVFIFSCKTVRPGYTLTGNNKNTISDAKALMAAFQQKAAEYKALCYQAYNVAHWRLDQFLETESRKPKAIMTDIDETVLDNSPYQVHQALQGKDYDPETWHDWTARGDADTVPGALRFFQYAASKDVVIFYVTNRDEDERKPTLENLKHFGFPFADDAHLMLMSNSSSKVSRRDSILAKYDLIMQVGDNLNDMSGFFEKKSVEERSDVTDNYRSAFGKQFIVLPNPSYGEWENALYKYNYNLTPIQKDSVLRSVLKNY